MSSKIQQIGKLGVERARQETTRYHKGVRVAETSRPNWRYAHTKNLLYASFTLNGVEHAADMPVDPGKESEGWPIVRERVNSTIDKAGLCLDSTSLG